MSKHALVGVFMVGLGATATACDRPAADDRPQDAVARSIEGIDAAVLASFSEEIVDLIETGRELYVVCSVCHGVDAAGTQLGPPLVGPEWIHITGQLEEIEEIVRVGVRNPVEYPVPMPELGGGDFDSEEIRAVATYIHTLASRAR